MPMTIDDHWRRGRGLISKYVPRRSNTEQCRAVKKYKEAVAVVVAPCAAKAKSQVCYIYLGINQWVMLS
jgi:coenzyme F420-reducing hydrogenase beta subunit